VPAGPKADLFARLDDLHSAAGRPSLRVIATKAGHGNISPSSVHNIFRSSRVPRWDFLEHVVRALGGSHDLKEFKALWEAAWREENAGTHRDTFAEGHVSGHSPRPDRESLTGINRTGVSLTGVGSGWADPKPRPSQRIWSNEIPPRNPDFTGRAAELEMIRDNLAQLPPRVQIVFGTGGIGKTEIAAEFIHRSMDRYEIIWWIRAEHGDRVRDALVKLGHRLALRQATADGDREKTIKAVLDALESETQATWLLVYDNTADPLQLQKYLPKGRPGGHVIITSRDQPKNKDVDGIEISPFTSDEAITFLRSRVPHLAPQDAGRLAVELGHLPIAIGHAAAYLAETAHGVDTYLAEYTPHARQPVGADLPTQVMGTWAMSTRLLTPDAAHLFSLCAFFSPEPIAIGLFLNGDVVTDDPPGMREFLASSRRVRAAASQLHRLSLAKVDGASDLIQVHRVVQAVTQARLSRDRGELCDAYRAAVEMLLAGSDPGNPDNSGNDVIYDLSLQHLESESRFLHTSNPALRDLFIGQVRRLHLRGAHVEAMEFGQSVLDVWRRGLGEDDLQVLALSVEVAVALYRHDRDASFHELILRIRPLLQRYSDGDGFKAFLLCENIRGADLRKRSQFREALDLDLSILPKFTSAFGADHERTLNVRHNIAVDYRQLGWFREALAEDQETLEARRRLPGSNEQVTLRSQTAVAHDLRSLGRYQESLDMAREVARAFEAVGGQENLPWLIACDGFATALRKAGHHWEARRESEQVVRRYRDYLGVDHMYTLQATINLINARRAVEDFADAEELARETRERCLRSRPPRDLLYAVLVNLASVLRLTGRPEEALLYEVEAREGLMQIYDDRHPFTLAADINYASDLATGGRLGEAIQLGHGVLSRCRQAHGDDHPGTLMAGANLAIDEAASGDRAGAERRLAEVLRRYEQTLTLEHPEARAAALGRRLTAEIDPYV